MKTEEEMEDVEPQAGCTKTSAKRKAKVKAFPLISEITAGRQSRDMTSNHFHNSKSSKSLSSREPTIATVTDDLVASTSGRT